MRDASASKSVPEQQRPAKTGPQLVPLEKTADAILQFEKESPDSDDDDVLPEAVAEPARVAPFPIDTVITPTEHAEPAPEAVEVAPSAPRNWRAALLPLLAVVVVTQAALLAYWAMSSRNGTSGVGATGNVTITSEPAGSPVAIDGSVRGQTPLTIGLAAGAHAIVVGAEAQAR